MFPLTDVAELFSYRVGFVQGSPSQGLLVQLYVSRLGLQIGRGYGTLTQHSVLISVLYPTTIARS